MNFRKLIQEGQELLEDKYVYHSSPQQDIKTFKPKPFVHSNDYSSSGRWDGKTKPPKGHKISNLVFAARRKHMPFYSLPREVPRMSVGASDEEQAMHKHIAKKHPDLKLGKKNMFVNEKHRKAMKDHSWSVYKFHKKHFKSLPGDQESVANRAVKPVEQKKHKNSVRYLEKHGWTVHFVPSVRRLAKHLRSKGHYPNGENID